MKISMVLTLLGVGMLYSSSMQAQEHGPTGQGKCAVAYKSYTQPDSFGTHEIYGFAWSYKTLEEAEAAAQTALMSHVNGAQIDTQTVGDGPGQGILLLASGCDFDHGVVAGTLKRPASGLPPLGNDIYWAVESALSGSTADAATVAIQKCKNQFGDKDPENNCHVLVQW